MSTGPESDTPETPQREVILGDLSVLASLFATYNPSKTSANKRKNTDKKHQEWVKEKLNSMSDNNNNSERNNNNKSISGRKWRIL